MDNGWQEIDVLWLFSDLRCVLVFMLLSIVTSKLTNE